MSNKLSSDEIKCNRCGATPEITVIDSSSLYKGVRCIKCKKIECLNCKGLPPDKPCSWCGGNVVPIGFANETKRSSAKFTKKHGLLIFFGLIFAACSTFTILLIIIPAKPIPTAPKPMLTPTKIIPTSIPNITNNLLITQYAANIYNVCDNGVGFSQAAPYEPQNDEIHPLVLLTKDEFSSPSAYREDSYSPLPTSYSPSEGFFRFEDSYHIMNDTFSKYGAVDITQIQLVVCVQRIATLISTCNYIDYKGFHYTIYRVSVSANTKVLEAKTGALVNSFSTDPVGFPEPCPNKKNSPGDFYLYHDWTPILDLLYSWYYGR